MLLNMETCWVACYKVSQCDVGRCNTLQYNTLLHNTIWYDMALHGMAEHVLYKTISPNVIHRSMWLFMLDVRGLTYYTSMWYVMVRCVILWCGLAWYNIVWASVVRLVMRWYNMRCFVYETHVHVHVLVFAHAYVNANAVAHVHVMSTYMYMWYLFGRMRLQPVRASLFISFSRHLCFVVTCCCPWPHSAQHSRALAGAAWRSLRSSASRTASSQRASVVLPTRHRLDTTCAVCRHTTGLGLVCVCGETWCTPCRILVT